MFHTLQGYLKYWQKKVIDTPRIYNIAFKDSFFP